MPFLTTSQPTGIGHSRTRAGAARAAVALVAGLTLLLAPGVTSAQSTETRAAARARAKPNAATTIDQPGARLFVPAGAVAGEGVIAFALGGVPGPDGRTDRPGAIVTAAGGLRSPAVVLFRPALAARAPGAGSLALRDVASGEYTPCQAEPVWVACLVPRAGAFVLDRGPSATGSDPLLREALAQPSGGTSGGTNRGRVARAALVVALAAGAGGLLGALAARRATA